MKLLQQSLRVTFGALLVLVLATACSGGGGHHDSADCSTPPGGDTGTDGGSAKSRVQQFNPDLAAAGDHCTPSYNPYCPAATSPTLFNDSTVGSRDDVGAPPGTEIGRAKVLTPVPNAQLVYRLPLSKKKI